jgi:5-methylcytosine-specific restriction endonuclease McrA
MSTMTTPSEAKRAKKREYQKAWMLAHPNYSRDAGRKWRLENADYNRLRVQKWKATNPEAVREHNRRASRKRYLTQRDIVLMRNKICQLRRRTSKTSKGLPFSRKELEAKLNFLGHFCAFCGTRENLHIDHIKPVIRGGPSLLCNLQLLCGSCNSSKGPKWEGVLAFRTCRDYLVSQAAITQNQRPTPSGG